jgi:8-oxo-dGTP pyrophosphatase MutT (NUDIX family)
VTKNSHCSFCGAAFVSDTPWPRACAACHNISYLNPLPVAVLLVPVDGGLLAVRRAIAPRAGMLALPGGFINWGESWQAAAVRELREETGLALAAERVREFRVLSAPDGTLLVFGIVPAIERVPQLSANEEVSELVVLRGHEELAFSLHAQCVAEFFAGARA